MKLKEMFIALLAGLFLVILLGIVFRGKETSKNQIRETTKTTTKTTISFETSVTTDPVFQVTSDTTYSVKNQSYTKKPIISKKINFPRTKSKFNSSSWKTKSPPSSASSPFGRDVYVSPQGEKKIIENPPNLSVTEKTPSSNQDVGGLI